MLKWLHHLIDPHCRECNRCKSCENLTIQLEIVNREKQDLLRSMLDLLKPVVKEVAPTQFQRVDPIKAYVPFDTRRRSLELESRKAAKSLRDEEERMRIIGNLEKELEINHGQSDGNDEQHGNEQTENGSGELSNAAGAR